jgi:hypothetical protein
MYMIRFLSPQMLGHLVLAPQQLTNLLNTEGLILNLTKDLTFSLA